MYVVHPVLRSCMCKSFKFILDIRTFNSANNTLIPTAIYNFTYSGGDMPEYRWEGNDGRGHNFI